MENPIGFGLLDHPIDVVRVSDVTLVEHNLSLQVVSGIFLAPPPSRPMDLHRGVMGNNVVGEVTAGKSSNPSNEDFHEPASSDAGGPVKFRLM